MTTAHLVAHLGTLGVALDASEGRLLVSDPGGALTLDLRAELVRRKPDVVALVEAARAPVAPDPALVARRYGGDGRPLSAGQARIWFLERLHPGSCAYHIPAVAELVGPLDVGALRASLGAIVGRHEPLRTALCESGGRPTGRLRPAAPFRLPVEDVTAGERAERLLVEARRPFDLETGPMLRARLLRLGPERHALALTTHHAASDGWSTAVLVREVAACYAAHRDGREAGLAPLAVRYADAAAWQAERQAGPGAAADLAATVRTLTPAPPPLTLPADRPPPLAPTFEGEVCERTPPRRLADAVRALARAEAASPFMVLLTAYAALLARTTGQATFAVGTPVAGRGHPALGPLVGLFVNTLALPLAVDVGGPFRALLRHVRDVSLDAFSRPEVPFERVVEAVAPPRAAGVPPLVQTLFVHQTVPVPPLALAGLAPAPVRFAGGTAKFDLSLFVEEAGGGYRFVGEFATARFDARTVADLLDTYEGLLSAALADPDGVVGQLPLRHAGPRPAGSAPAARAPAPAEVRVREAERLVASVWSRLLGDRAVGRDDGFFDLGGHSLLAVQAQRQLAAALGREVPLLDLFAHPTPRALGRHLASGGEGASGGLAGAQASGVQARVARRLAARAASRDRTPPAEAHPTP